MNSVLSPYKYLLILAVLAIPVMAQLDQAMAQYESGKFEEASRLFQIELQQQPQNAQVWNLYALSLNKLQEHKRARIAFEKAIALAPENSDYLSNLSFNYLAEGKWKKAEKHASAALQVNPVSGNAYIARALARIQRGKFDEAFADSESAIKYAPETESSYLLHVELLVRNLMDLPVPIENQKRVALLERSVETLKMCIDKCVGERAEARDKLESFRAFLAYYSELDLEQNSDCVPMRVTKRTSPSYTEAARRNNVEGIVRIMAVFKSDGTIGRTIVLKRLESGLTEKSLEALRSIRFDPETCGGKPVTVVKTVAYSFDIY